MKKWGAVILLLAVSGTAVLADNGATFPELVQAANPGRIVSGWEAQDGQFPHQLSLRLVSPVGSVTACGGTIIHPEWGLTAAHCTAGRLTVIVRAGTVNLTLPTLLFETTKYYNHPLYDNEISFVQPHDIGLIDFERTLTFSDTVQPIRLQRSSVKNQDYTGAQAIATGWGRLWGLGVSPENMNWVYLRITSNQDCSSIYPTIVVDSTICTRGYNLTSQSTCQGDSGGPLTIIDDDGGLTQVGVTSFVHILGCHQDFPAGFIRPGHYHDWFTEVSGINFDWEYEPNASPTPVDVTN